MKGIYTPNLHCEACLDTADLFGGITAEQCEHCRKINQEEVSIMSYGDGIFGNKVTIIHKDGRIESVDITEVIALV